MNGIACLYFTIWCIEPRMTEVSHQSKTSQHLPRALAILIIVTGSFMFAANHVAARLAFDDGTGVLLALLVRGSVALLIMFALVCWQGHKLVIPLGRRRWQLLLGTMIAGQSLCLYSAVARVPVAVALLMVNTWPIFLALITWALSGARPSGRLVMIMVIIMGGLILVLDVQTWLADPAAMGPDWQPGVVLALMAAVFFSLAIWTTNNKLASLPGAVRSVYTMVVVLTLMAIGGGLSIVPAGLSLPAGGQGWLGLGLLALLYGGASTVLFVLVPRLDMARNAPVMNIEPVWSLLLAYLVLGQTLAPVQLLGGAIVLAGILWLSLMRHP